MSTRPQPRTSKLTGYTHVTTPTSQTRRSPEQPATTMKIKVTFRVDADLMDQARAAFWTCGPRTGVSSLAEWIQEAIEATLADDIATFNDGQPFAPVPTGRLPTGRR